MSTLPLIIDTDIDMDCDDAGALAVAHALIARGQVDLLGVICSIPEPWCAPCVQAINAWYGRPEIPVGAIRIEDWHTNPTYREYRTARGHYTQHGTRAPYNEVIGRAWRSRAGGSEAQEAVGLYRRLLAQQEDGRVVICAIGTLAALAQLLQSAPDDISPLSGRELIVRKVACLVTMALGIYPEGCDCFNWYMDRLAAGKVLAEWPTPIRVSYYGETVCTGQRFMATAPADHPVATAFRTWLGSDHANRPSWDQLTLLCAAHAAGGLFAPHADLALVFDPATGAHHWHPGGRHGYFHPLVDDAVLAQRVDELMIESLGQP